MATLDDIEDATRRGTLAGMRRGVFQTPEETGQAVTRLQELRRDLDAARPDAELAAELTELETRTRWTLNAAEDRITLTYELRRVPTSADVEAETSNLLSNLEMGERYNEIYADAAAELDHGVVWAAGQGDLVATSNYDHYQDIPERVAGPYITEWTTAQQRQILDTGQLPPFEAPTIYLSVAPGTSTGSEQDQNRTKHAAISLSPQGVVWSKDGETIEPGTVRTLLGQPAEHFERALRPALEKAAHRVHELVAVSQSIAGEGDSIAHLTQGLPARDGQRATIDRLSPDLQSIRDRAAVSFPAAPAPVAHEPISGSPAHRSTSGMSHSRDDRGPER